MGLTISEKRYVRVLNTLQVFLWCHFLMNRMILFAILVQKTTDENPIEEKMRGFLSRILGNTGGNGGYEQQGWPQFDSALT